MRLTSLVAKIRRDWLAAVFHYFGIQYAWNCISRLLNELHFESLHCRTDAKDGCGSCSDDETGRICSMDMRNSCNILAKRPKGNKTRVFWDIPPCSLVGKKRRFGGAYCQYYQGDDWGSTHFWNVGLLQQYNTAVYPIRMSALYLPPWEPEISPKGRDWLGDCADGEAVCCWKWYDVSVNPVRLLHCVTELRVLVNTLRNLLVP
jgi:hypothetical protein